MGTEQEEQDEDECRSDPDKDTPAPEERVMPLLGDAYTD